MDKHMNLRALCHQVATHSPKNWPADLLDRLRQELGRSPPVSVLVAELQELAREWRADINASDLSARADKRNTKPKHFLRDLEAILARQPEARGVMDDAIRHLSKWLDMAECECESGHQCGRSEVEDTRNRLHALTAAQQPEARGVVDADYQYGLDFIRKNQDAIVARCSGPTERHVIERTFAALAVERNG